MQNVLDVRNGPLLALFQVGRFVLVRECCGLDPASKKSSAVSADALSPIAHNRDRFADFDSHQVMACDNRPGVIRLHPGQDLLLGLWWDARVRGQHLVGQDSQSWPRL